MPLVNVIKHACDGSGRKRSYGLASDFWHTTKIDGSFGSQPVWHYLVANEAGTCIAYAKIYEDRARKLRGGRRLYCWSVTPAGENEAFSHGKCVSLRGAKIVARACANLVKLCDPYREQEHR